MIKKNGSVFLFILFKKGWYAHEVLSYIKVINIGIMYILYTALDMKF